MVDAVPIVEELPPGRDAWDAAQRFAAWPHLLFLDSAERHPERGRYSYVTADPVAWVCDEPFRPLPCPAVVRPDGVPPFVGGWAGLFGYALGRSFDRMPLPRHDEFRAPDLALGLYDWVMSFDHMRNRAWIVSTGIDEHSADAGRARARLKQVREQLERPPSPRAPEPLAPPAWLYPRRPLPGHEGVWSNFAPAEFRAAVQRAVEYVHAGDCFQVNLSQRLLAPLTEHPLALYGRLRAMNPAPFACYFDLGAFQIASASPERFLQVDRGEVVTRPIKGTRPRGATPAEDAALIRDLTTNPKDRAENVMIVDLLRNDLGRVCAFGSVAVPRVCELETYPFVHHLVSEVRGRLRPGCSVWDLLRASFPGGSVTGAPKVRALEIIAELEPTARGAYCGSVGYLGADGGMDANILIRTFTAGRGWLQFPVGGGIVADSDPHREYDETLHKAAGLLGALAR